MSFLAALALAGGAACAGGTSSGDTDASTPGVIDASDVVDAAITDIDSAIAIDGRAADATPPDAGLPDAAPPDASIPLGMRWPDTQVFPSFARIEHLDVIGVGGRAPDALALMTTLQGLVNRTQPRIYIPEGSDADELWLDELHVATTAFDDPLALVRKYQDEIEGIVIYDPALEDTLNLATTIAGIEDGIVASPALSSTLMGAPYSLRVIADLRTQHFTSKLQVYQYELDHYAPRASHRLLIGLRPGIADHLRDYAVATRAMNVWLDPNDAAERALLSQFLRLLPPNAPYMGWWTDEGAGVHLAATFGVPVYAADWSSNLTVLGGAERGGIVAPVAPPPPPLENKLYVAIFMSDGDNLQEDQHLIPLKWARPGRGQVPIAWTINPALVDVAPLILRYFYRTSTINDVLVAGPSGLGYTYPAAWPSGVFEQYARVTGPYMAAAGLRISTLWNNGADLSDADARAYVTHVPGLQGLTIQDAPQALRLIDGRIPLVRMALSYGDTAEILERGIDEQIRSFTGAGPQFAAVQGNMNMGTISPDAFVEVQRHYALDTNVVFVRPDHFFHLLTAATHPPGHKIFDGDFNGDGKTDQMFYYAGDGNWWLGLSSGEALTWSHAGNVASLGNLLDGKHAFYVADVDSGGTDDIVVYDSRDNRWRLGISNGATLTWRDAGVGSGVTALLDGKHRVSTGDFDADGKEDVLVYNGGDGTWRLGRSDGNALTWRVVDTSPGFGNLLDGAHAVWDGDWNGDGRSDVLFFYNGDRNWWMGLSDGNALTWHGAGNSDGFGNLIDGGHRVLVGDWNHDRRTDVMFHYAGDGNWWMGLSDGNAFAWHHAGTTAGSKLLDWNHRLYVGDIDADHNADVIAYDAARGTWSAGRSDGHALTWQDIDNTSGFGDLLDPSRRLSVADHDGDGRTDAMFYYNGDGNWWLRRASANPATWRIASNTRGFGDLLH